jgi:hypothetical protein
MRSQSLLRYPVVFSWESLRNGFKRPIAPWWVSDVARLYNHYWRPAADTPFAIRSASENAIVPDE